MKIDTTELPSDQMKHNSSVWSVIKNITNDIHQEEAFYVCDLSEIIEKHKIWTFHLPKVMPYYAVKCNDDINVLKILAALGTGFDCASKGEISKVLSLGISTERIIFANPSKPISHIRYAASVGVSLMTFDNESELYKIQNIFPNARLVIRIRVDAKDAQCPLGMKFGCDVIRDAPRLLRLAKFLNLNVVGVSFHVGSGCREPAVFHRAIAAARELFNYSSSLGFKFSILDLGGGYPGARGSSMDQIADIINGALSEFFQEPDIRVIAEPGRFYVTSAYTLACNIYSIRKIFDEDEEGNPFESHRMYYINDGVYGSFNCILYDHQIMSPIPLKLYAEEKRIPSTLWGPTCDGLDQVTEEILLPDMNIGDWIAFEDMGAYTLPVASQFNGFPIPKVYYIITEVEWYNYKDNVMLPRNTVKIVDEDAQNHLQPYRKSPYFTFADLSVYDLMAISMYLNPLAANTNTTPDLFSRKWKSTNK